MKLPKKNIVPKLLAAIIMLSLVGHTVFFGYTRSIYAAFYISLPSYELQNVDNTSEKEIIQKPDMTESDFSDLPVIKYATEVNNDDTISEEVYNEINSLTELYGLDDIVYQPENDKESEDTLEKFAITNEMLKGLSDVSYDYIKKNFYTVDKKTDILSQQLDVTRFLSHNMKIDNTISGPKVLIFHTHVYEAYVGSDTNNYKDGVIAVGNELKKVLEEKYGIETLHHTERYDMVDGKVNINGAYQRIEPGILKVLKENPSIQVVIDLHRDGVLGNTKFVTQIEGESVAKIMFVNGLSQTASNGKVEALSYLDNPNRETNLALSFQLQLLANEKFPDLSRKVYLNAYRYSLHMMPKSILLEVGNQNNTKQEALNAMHYFAAVLAGVISD